MLEYQICCNSTLDAAIGDLLGLSAGSGTALAQAQPSHDLLFGHRLVYAPRP